MDCVFRDGACVHCGWQWAGDPRVRRNCWPAEPARLRSGGEQAAVAAICRGCQHFDPAAGDEGCRKCGCTSERHERWLSLLRIGDCPRGLWPQERS